MDQNNNNHLAEPVARLIDEFNKLPGIGPKSAQRLTYHLVRMPADQAQALAEAILSVKHRITSCSECQNITEHNPCSICSDVKRDHTRICVVEEPLDVLALERTHAYRGMYHVLHGVISPMNGIGPDDLKLRELVTRIKSGVVTELILAINPTLEGEATATYIQRLFAPLGLQLSRLARGLPAGSDLEYADLITLTRAIEGRQKI